MKKYISYLVGILILLIPIHLVKADEVSKFTTSFENNNTIDYNILGSSIIGGNDIRINSTIDGVGVIMGNNVIYNATSDYALVMGNNIDYTGSAKDAVILGNVVTVNANSKISRDLIICANKVNIAGDFSRNVTIYASDVTIDNSQFGGLVKTTSDKLTIKDNVIISGGLSYNDDADTSISQIANVGSVTTFVNKNADEPNLVETIYSHVSKIIAILVIFTALFYLVPKLFTGMDKESKNIVGNIGYGLIYFIACPIISIILCLTVFGLGLGFLSLLIYIAILLISLIPTGYILGNVIWDRFIKLNKAKLVCGYMGITIIYLLTIIPRIGNLILIIVILLGMGTIIKKIKPKTNKKAEVKA